MRLLLFPGAVFLILLLHIFVQPDHPVKNQAFDRTMITRPKTVQPTSKVISPYTHTGNPSSENIAKTFAARMMLRQCRFGLLEENTFTKVPLDAQLVVDFGIGKARGLYQIHQAAAATASSAYQSSQRRLQIARLNKGKQVKNLVHTLHGLAWRSQTESCIARAFSA